VGSFTRCDNAGQGLRGKSRLATVGTGTATTQPVEVSIPAAISRRLSTGRTSVDRVLWQARREEGRGIHVAGVMMHNGYKMDIHSRTVADSTLALLDEVLGRAPCVNAVVFEMLKEAIPAMGLDGLANELLRLRGVLEFLRSYDTVNK